MYELNFCFELRIYDTMNFCYFIRFFATQDLIDVHSKNLISYLEPIHNQFLFHITQDCEVIFFHQQSYFKE